MLAWIRLVLSILITTQLTYASIEGTELMMGTGVSELNTCRVGVMKFTFDYKILGLGHFSKFWDSVCGYPPAVGSLLLCTYDLTNNDTSFQQTIFKKHATRCAEYSSYDHDASYYKEQFENATEYYVPLKQLNTSESIYVPTLPNMKQMRKTYTSYQSRIFNVDVGTWFAVGICGYFLLLILIGAIYNALRILGITKTINNSKFSKLIQKYIISSTLLPNGKFNQPYGYKYFTMLIPNRLEFLADLFLVGLEIAFYCVPYRTSSSSTRIGYIGYRSGIMAFGKIPLLILFAGRNNFLLWITGWSYGTFLHFHKVVAGLMFVDALVHSVVYTIDYLGRYVSELHERYFACGVAATIFCGILLLHSLHILRSFFYEYFLVMHVILAVCFIVMCWYHCVDEGWMEWMVAACCVWFFDRFVRVIRMSIFGYRTAKITAVGENMIKIEVPKPGFWRHTPGSYGFVYFAGIIFWENHPFTIVVEDNKLCAYVMVKMGVTARVWKQLMKHNGEMNWKVCIEGPYGGHLSLMHKRYDDFLFIAGGSGVPGILEAAAAESSSNGKFVWVVPKLNFVHAYSTLIKRCTLPIDIYVTRESAKDVICSQSELFSRIESDIQTSDSSEKSSVVEEIDNNKLNVTNNQQISVHYGRPDLENIINAAVTESQYKNLALVLCGPPVMTDNVRNIYTRHINNWEKSVDIFDELLVW